MCRTIFICALLPLGIAINIRHQPTPTADDIKKSFASRECNDTIFANFSLVLQQMKRASMKDLAAPNYVRDMVRQVGLTPSERKTAAGNSIYGEEVNYRLPVSSPISTGMWQVPQQVDCAMAKLRELKIQNVLTVGTWSGWTDLFLGAYLQRFAPNPDKFTLTTFDIDPYVSSCIGKAMPLFHVSRVVFGDPALTDSALAGKSPDDVKDHRSCSKSTANVSGCTLEKYMANSTEQIGLCFLDGDHHYAQVKKEFEFLRNRCRSFMFHDVVNSRVVGVPEFWKDMKAGKFFDKDKDKYQIEECLYQPVLSDQHIFGIGIIINNESNFTG